MSRPDCNVKETLESETLGILAEKIVRYANEADEKTIEAAKPNLNSERPVGWGSGVPSP